MEHKDSPVNYVLEFHDITPLEKLFFHHEDKNNIINIIQQGSRCHIDPIEEETIKSDLDAIIIRETINRPTQYSTQMR